MSDVQLYPAIGVPKLAVIASLVVSLVQVSGVRAEIKSIRTEMQSIRAEIQTLRTEMQSVRAEVHEDMREIRAALATLTSIVYERMGTK